MSDERNNLAPVSSETQPVYNLATGRFEQRKRPPAPDTLTISSLSPNQTPPAGPLAPTGVSHPPISATTGSGRLLIPTLLWSQETGHYADWQSEQRVLRDRISRMYTDMPESLRNQASITSGYRTNAEQADAWRRHVETGRPSVVAHPADAGHLGSLHEQGLAADWNFDSPEAYQWMKQNASRYGLNFPLANDPYHMQTVEHTARNNDTQYLGNLLPGVPPQYRGAIADAAYSQGLNPRLFASMIAQESDFNPNAGPQIGLGQLTKDTAKDMGVDPDDINDNLMGAAKRLRQMYEDPRVAGDTRKALMLYKSGPNVGTPFQNTQYADAVVNRYRSAPGVQIASTDPAPLIPSTYNQPPPVMTSWGGAAGIPGLMGGQSGPTSVAALPQAPWGGGATAPVAPVGHGPSDQPTQGPTQTTPGQTPQPILPQPALPQALNSAQLMAMMFAMSAQRASFQPITYDPWAIQQIGRANPNIGQSLANLGTYTTRVGTKVPGPA